MFCGCEWMMHKGLFLKNAEITVIIFLKQFISKYLPHIKKGHFYSLNETVT